MGQFMRAFVQDEPENWDHYIAFAMHSYNNTPHSTTGYTPHELMFGFKAELPINLTNKPQPTYNYDNYISELRYRLQHTHRIARQNLTDRMHSNKKYYDKKVNMPSFNVGDRVLLRKQKRDNKYDHPYENGWTIQKMLTPVTADIVKNGHRRRAHVDALIHEGDQATIETTELNAFDN